MPALRILFFGRMAVFNRPGEPISTVKAFRAGTTGSSATSSAPPSHTFHVSVPHIGQYHTEVGQQGVFKWAGF